MQAVILAAGQGKRLGLKLPKILVPLHKDITLLEYHILGLRQIGIKEVVIAGGYKCSWIERKIKQKELGQKCQIFLVCVDWRNKGNGYSLFQLRDLIKDKFLLLMGDLFLEYPILERLLKKTPITIGIDTKPQIPITEKTTKVKIKKDKIAQIKKGELANFDGVEFGLALVDRRIFRYKIDLASDWIDILSQIIKDEKVKFFDLKGAFWKNINYKRDLEEVRRYFKFYENFDQRS